MWMTDNAKLGGSIRGPSKRVLNVLEEGQVGQAMEMMSRGYRYKITERNETDDCISVTMTAEPVK